MDEISGTVCHEFEKDNAISWNDSFAVFDVNADDLCTTTCTKEGESSVTINMNDYCWDKYSNDSRATATCQEDDSEYIVQWDSEIEYPITFCDRGNNLQTYAEEYVDQNGDGVWSDNDNQSKEPFEDRNCNSDLDSAESITLEDCPKIQDQDATFTFCDEGNGQWDDEETCFLGGDCGYNYLYLFTRSIAPDQLIVNYEDQDNPVIWK